MNNDHSKTCMKHIPPEYLEVAMEMHKALYIEGAECTQMKCTQDDCTGEWTFDYGSEGHHCSGSCHGYDGAK